jgi:murein DD-endopeptidase MepM/ murein hydrolase activator NlpD
MTTIRPSGKIIIGGVPFQTDARVVNFRERPFWDASKEICQSTSYASVAQCEAAGPNKHFPYGLPANYPKYTKRYSTRPALRRADWAMGERAPYEAVKSVIKQFVIHHDGCSTAEMCWNVLQNERGLSCHFLVDNDGTIYQTLDLALMGYHAAEWNVSSIGVELCNRGDAKSQPGFYSSGKFGPDRDKVACKINGHTYLAFDYTEAQYREMKKLSRALLRLLPNLPPEYPQSSPGQQAWDTLKSNVSHAFSGYIGHYHLTAEKWDPGWFDFKKYCGDLRGELVFPLFPRAPKRDQRAPTIPTEQSELKADAELLYAMNEREADGGFYPVGPWGEHRLWHGGAHLARPAGDPVFAPFPGRLVAARMAPPTAVGSVSFVLLRHQMQFDRELKIDFFTLYMHLADELSRDEAARPEWMTRESKDGAGWRARGKRGEIVLLDEPIEAGAKLGHVGTAGPAELAKGQVHLEVFSQSHLFDAVPSSPWTVIDGSGSGRFCDAQLILDGIDGNKDRLLSRSELTGFYGGGGGAQNRYMVVLHVSEWTAEPSWAEALRAAKDFKSMKPSDIDQLVADQIAPTLWWDAVARHARLPPDGMVYHYNPIAFVSWVNAKINDASAAAATEKPPDARDAKEVPPGVTDDLGDVDGSSMRSSTEHLEDPCNEKLGLKEMVEGFDTPECTP